MNEHLVEWTLLREVNYIQTCINLPLERKVCQQFTTNFGRIDFAHKIKNGGYLITELETIIDSKAKLSYCLEQTLSYKNIRFNSQDEHQTAILFAKQTNLRFQNEILEFCKSNDVLPFFYDLDKVKQIYNSEIEKSLINNGVPLMKPVAMNLTHLGLINRFFIPYHITQKSTLKKDDFKKYFQAIDTGKNETVFNVVRRGAEYFDLIISNGDYFTLTDYGIKFRDGLNSIAITENIKRIDLSLEQKRIMIASLLNGNFYEKKSKINIYYFLKFVSFTEGDWLPKGRKFDTQAKYEFINNFFRMDYSEGSVADLLRFTCNQCEELGLVEKIKTSGFYDRVIFSSLGSRVLSFLELDIQLKREKIQIPLQL
jgi:hypothetical protein